MRFRLLALLLLAMLPLVGLAIFNAATLRREMLEASGDQAAELAKLGARDFNELVSRARQLLDLLTRVPAVASGTPDECHEFLRTAAPSYPWQVRLLRIDRDGLITCNDEKASPGIMVADRDYFTAVARNGGFALGGYSIGRSSGRAVMIAAQAMPDGGAVAVSLDLAWIGAMTEAAFGHSTAFAAILDREGRYLARFPSGPAVGALHPDHALVAAIQSGVEGTLVASNEGGTGHIVAFVALPGDARLIVGFGEEEILAPAVSTYKTSLLLLAAACLFAVLLSGVGSEVLVLRWIRAIIDGCRELAAGKVARAIAVPQDSGELAVLAATFNQMSSTLVARGRELAAAAETLQYTVEHNQLTGLPNERPLDAAVGSLLKDGISGFSLTKLVLARFDEVEATLGQDFSHRLLQALAKRLKEVAGRDGALYHIGGGRFVLLGLDGGSGGERDAAAMIRVLEDGFTIGGVTYFLEGCAGIARFPRDGTSTVALLRASSSAAIQARRNGRQAEQFDAGQDLARLAMLTMLTELRQAFTSEQLELYFQPKVASGSRVCSGVEALIRWNHPTDGMKPPATFIAAAEQTGIIQRITHWSLESACRQIGLWNVAGIEMPIAVNLSARDLADEHLARRISDSLGDYGLGPAYLEVEVTESALMSDPRSAQRLLETIRDQGISIAIDDFGTGHSSLAYLKDLPVDRLKIDQVFVRGVNASRKNQIIVRNTLSLAHDLGMSVVAEGVETAEECAFLEDLGCDYMQGYHFGKPMATTAFEAWLAR